MRQRKTIYIVAAVLILAILSLFIPALKQKKDLTSADEGKKDEVVYDGNTEDTESIEDDSTDVQEDRKP